jgi:glutathione synthase/RimK-type ligase-like ATP-grasp enzyme
VAATKRVLLTASAPLVDGGRCMTPRSLATALDERADLLVIPAGGYDFDKGVVRAYRRVRGGRFEAIGMVEPAADLWIVYSDGYYLDHRALGFDRRKDFFDAQIAFHQNAVDTGTVGRVVNAPAVETRTLKGWLATLDADAFRVVPTRVFSSIDEVHDFRRAAGTIVAKPDWGGGGGGVQRLAGEHDVQRFADVLARGDEDLRDYCFQRYCPGDEKRFWFAGGRFVAARTLHGRKTPWSAAAHDFHVRRYDERCEGFAKELETAQHLCTHAGLEVGAIDFLGDRINEINGGGTVFTEYRGWECVVDARPALVDYALDLLRVL